LRIACSGHPYTAILNHPARLNSSNKATEGGGGDKGSEVVAAREVDCGVSLEEGRGGDTAAARVVVAIDVASEICPPLRGDTTSELEVAAGVG